MNAPGGRQSKAALAVLLVGLSTGMGGAVLAVRELAPFYDLSTLDAGKFALVSNGGPVLPIAESSRLAVLEECYRTASSIYARAQPTSKRQAYLDACMVLSDTTTSAAPVLGLAWAISGALGGERRDADRLSRSLLMSQRATPNEQWLAEFRTNLTETYSELASDALFAAEAKDLEILVRSPRGVKSIARRYVEHVEFRDRVTKVVEQMGPSDQRHFLDALRAAVNAQGQVG